MRYGASEREREKEKGRANHRVSRKKTKAIFICIFLGARVREMETRRRKGSAAGGEADAKKVPGKCGQRVPHKLNFN